MKWEAWSQAEHERAMRRMDRIDKRAQESDRRARESDRRFEKRMAEADERMNKFQTQLLATKRLVEAGMKIVMGLAKSHRELEKSQKAFLNSLRRGNGNGHRR